MGIHHQYHANASPNLNNTSTSDMSKNNDDFIWNNPNELDLLEMKNSFIMNTTENQKSFLRVLPSVRRLFIIFNSICPNIYRIHGSDSLRILKEILCLTEQYLQVYSSITISTNELLSDEKYFNEYISKLRSSSYIPEQFHPPKKPVLRCFGQGICAHNYNNELNQTILFCFELTTNDVSLPIDICISDPDGNSVPVDIKYINIYNQGYTTLFSCSYTPISKAGVYKVSFFYNNVKITNQHYSVFVSKSTSNDYSCKQKGQLLSEEVMTKIQQGKHGILFIFN